MFVPSVSHTESRIKSLSIVTAVGNELSAEKALDSSRWKAIQMMNQDFRAKHYTQQLITHEELRPMYSNWVCRGVAATYSPPKMVRMLIVTLPIEHRDEYWERLYEYECPGS